MSTPSVVLAVRAAATMPRLSVHASSPSAPCHAGAARTLSSTPPPRAPPTLQRLPARPEPTVAAPAASSILGCRGHHFAVHLSIPVGRHAPASAPNLRTAAVALPRYAPPTTSLMDRNIFPVSTIVIFYDRPSSRVTLCAGKKPAPCGVFREPWPSSVQQPPPHQQSISFPLL